MSIPAPLRPSALRLRRALAAALGLLVLLCSLAAAPAMAAPNATYSKDGVSFEYPAGWRVAEDVVAEDGTRLRSIDLEGPDESIVTFMISPFLKDQKIEAFAATTARNRAESSKGAAGATAAEQVEFGPTASTAITRNVAGNPNKGVSQRFIVTLQGLKLPHEARFFKVHLGGTTAIIMTQVADESAAAAEPGFTMALDTLRYNGKR